MTDTRAGNGRRRITGSSIAVVCGATALAVSLGVPSEAAKLIDGKNLKNNSVTGHKIKNGTLTGADIKNNAVKGKDVKESSLKGVLKTGDVAAFGNATSASLDDFTTSSFTPLVSTAVTASSDGVLYITGAVSAEDDSSLTGDGNLLYRLRLDGTALSASSFAHELAYPGAGAGDSGAATAVVPVTKGAHTVHLDGREIGAGSFVIGREVSVLFVPTGDGFVPPARVTTRRPVQQ